MGQCRIKMRLIEIKVNNIRVLIFFVQALLVQSIFTTSTYVLAKLPQEFETSLIITAKAKSFLEETVDPADKTKIEVKVNQLDQRLRLKKCENDLNAYFPTGSQRTGRVTIAVSCDFPVAWKVFVSASLYEYSEVVVARKTLPRKSLISKDDIALERVNISKLRGTPILDPNQVVGSATKRQIRAGAVVFGNSICMVCKGADVQVVAKNDNFNINMEGTALADAAIGEITQIRNKKSKRSFNAKVIGRNQLVVLLRP